MRVQVYYNLHKKCLSVRHKGKVIDHTNIVALENIKFHVQPAGQAKVRREKRKNVHAYVAGDLITKEKFGRLPNSLELVKYNPYKNDFFVDVEGNELREVYSKGFIKNKDIFVAKRG